MIGMFGSPAMGQAVRTARERQAAAPASSPSTNVGLFSTPLVAKFRAQARTAVPRGTVTEPPLASPKRQSADVAAATRARTRVRAGGFFGGAY